MINSTLDTTINDKNGENGQVSMPKLLLHTEGVALLGVALTLYALQGFAWSTFFLFLLLPDLAFLPYLINKKVGTVIYNALHTLTLPLALTVFSILTDATLGIQLSLIWFAHIGMDRAIGYGLKYVDSFRNTHLSKV